MNLLLYLYYISIILSIFIGGHNSILKGIAILEILISFAVVFEKTRLQITRAHKKRPPGRFRGLGRTGACQG